MTVSRFLFRDDVLIATGTTLKSFEEMSLKGDYLLVDNTYKFPNQWLSYEMVFFPDHTEKWGWFTQPTRITDRLRTLLLLQR